MKTHEAYNNWAKTYDTIVNLTRDLEAKALRTLLKNIKVENILEIGCGTGKNSQWLAGKCKHLQSVDFSEEMLQLAKEKVKEKNIRFLQADITRQWNINNYRVVALNLKRKARFCCLIIIYIIFQIIIQQQKQIILFAKT